MAEVKISGQLGEMAAWLALPQGNGPGPEESGRLACAKAILLWHPICTTQEGSSPAFAQ